MYICMYVLHTYVHTYSMYVHIYVCMFCIRTYIHTVCMYIYMYVCFAYVRTYIQYVCTYIHILYYRYSLDEGATWYHHQFHNSTTFRTYGMLTEPGEATLVFGIYGADTSRWPHDWIVIRIDFSDILC